MYTETYIVEGTVMHTRVSLIDDLHSLGIHAGDVLVVHSSMKSIGAVDGGAHTVIDALMETVTPRGTLLMPSFTYSLKTNDLSEGFDRENTPSVTGVISELFRQRSDVIRSEHPTHSIAAWGASAQRLASGHREDSAAFGAGTPFDMLPELNGYILHIGVDLRSSSLIHVGEMRAHIWYADIFPFSNEGLQPWALVKRANGNVDEIPQTFVPGSSNGFNAFELPLKKRGLITYGKIGNASVRLLAARPFLETVIELLEEDPDYALLPSDERFVLRDYCCTVGHV